MSSEFLETFIPHLKQVSNENHLCIRQYMDYLETEIIELKILIDKYERRDTLTEGVEEEID